MPIADHGLVGDLRTCALVAADGTIDWYCPGRFDSPSVFAALLDGERGGAWRLIPVDGSTSTHQFYFPESAILITRFLTDEGVAEVHDFMPVLRPHDPDHRQRLVRRLVGVRGHTRLRMKLDARPAYGRAVAEVTGTDDGVLIEGPQVRLGLSATTGLDLADGTVTRRSTWTRATRCCSSWRPCRTAVSSRRARSATSPSCSTPPRGTGAAGWRSRPTPDGGGRWCTGRR
jgi:GH15 family glucan-1,4-alpha-glucosidase